MPNISNGTMFRDLDWPLSASREFVSISWAACCYCWIGTGQNAERGGSAGFSPFFFFHGKLVLSVAVFTTDRQASRSPRVIFNHIIEPHFYFLPLNWTERGRWKCGSGKCVRRENSKIPVVYAKTKRSQTVCERCSWTATWCTHPGSVRTHGLSSCAVHAQGSH